MASARLVRAIGRFDLTAGVVNSVVGAGIFGAPAAVAALTGPWSPVAALAAGLGILTVVLCFAEVGSRFDDSGGPYLYTRAAFGRHVSFAVGWLHVWTRLLTAAAGTGHANIFPDRDGAVRSIGLVARFGNGYYPSFILETARLAAGLPDRLTVQTVHGDLASPNLLLRAERVAVERGVHREDRLEPGRARRARRDRVQRTRNLDPPARARGELAGHQGRGAPRGQHHLQDPDRRRTHVRAPVLVRLERVTDQPLAPG